MKQLFYTLLGLSLFTSCSPTVYYQVYSGESAQVRPSGDLLAYEDATCKITYNLWSEGGNLGFTFYNKTDQPIYLHLDQCFFVKNGLAQDYYQGRVYSESSSNTISRPASGWWWGYTPMKTQITGSTSSISTPEPRIVCVPSKTARQIYEFSIVGGTYRNCELIRYPSGEKQMQQSAKFDQANSPYQLSNRLAYSSDAEGKNVTRLQHDFYVTEIQNLSEAKFKKYGYDQFCDQSIAAYQYPLQASHRFYVRYVKSGYTKH